MIASRRVTETQLYGYFYTSDIISSQYVAQFVAHIDLTELGDNVHQLTAGAPRVYLKRLLGDPNIVQIKSLVFLIQSQAPSMKVN
jgi:hypothetical protein